MLKRIFIFKLKEGTNPDEFWKHWENKHAAEYKKMPYLKKYSINKLYKVTKGEPAFWGMAETWWDSEADHEKMEQTPQAKAFKDEYFSAHIADGFGAWFEEKQMK